MRENQRAGKGETKLDSHSRAKVRLNYTFIYFAFILCNLLVLFVYISDFKEFDYARDFFSHPRSISRFLRLDFLTSIRLRSERSSFDFFFLLPSEKVRAPSCRTLVVDSSPYSSL